MNSQGYSSVAHGLAKSITPRSPLGHEDFRAPFPSSQIESAHQQDPRRLPARENLRCYEIFCSHSHHPWLKQLLHVLNMTQFQVPALQSQWFRDRVNSRQNWTRDPWHSFRSFGDADSRFSFVGWLTALTIGLKEVLLDLTGVLNLSYM